MPLPKRSRSVEARTGDEDRRKHPHHLRNLRSLVDINEVAGGIADGRKIGDAEREIAHGQKLQEA